MKNWILEVLDIAVIRTHIVWYILCWFGVMFAMAIDLVTGVRKAKKLGIARTSLGLKKTCDKAMKYFLPMLCLMPVDVMASVLIPVPVLTMAWAAFCAFCEFKSVMESTHTKKEINDAAQTMQVVVKNKEDLMQTFCELLNQMKKEEDES